MQFRSHDTSQAPIEPTPTLSGKCRKIKHAQRNTNSNKRRPTKTFRAFVGSCSSYSPMPKDHSKQLPLGCGSTLRIRCVTARLLEARTTPCVDLYRGRIGAQLQASSHRIWHRRFLYIFAPIASLQLCTQACGVWRTTAATCTSLPNPAQPQTSPLQTSFLHAVAS